MNSMADLLFLLFDLQSIVPNFYIDISEKKDS